MVFSWGTDLQHFHVKRAWNPWPFLQFSSGQFIVRTLISRKNAWWAHWVQCCGGLFIKTQFTFTSRCPILPYKSHRSSIHSHTCFKFIIKLTQSHLLVIYCYSKMWKILAAFPTLYFLLLVNLYVGPTCIFYMSVKDMCFIV